jgi:sugar phosphate isomerase/epimerase
MKVGLEGNHIYGYEHRTIFQTLDCARRLGADGVFVKTVMDLSPKLDAVELRDVQSHADSLGLYLECGIGPINPYNTCERPEIRALGGGDYRRAVESMIHAARSIGCTELWADTATSVGKSAYAGNFNNDRYRTDVSWNDQLAAVEKFLRLLVPVLRDTGSRIDIETHEDITSFEVVRLVESIGPDVAGITFDTGNGILRCEDPIAVARRVAPYTHLTHIKDAVLYFDDDGLVRQIPPCGQGFIDWKELITILGTCSPDLHLSIEDHKGLGKARIFDPRWLAAHPDLRAEELVDLVRAARICEKKIASGERPDPAAYEAIPFERQWEERLTYGIRYLRDCIREINAQPMDNPTAEQKTL